MKTRGYFFFRTRLYTYFKSAIIIFLHYLIFQTRVRLTHQASNFEQEIRKVEEKISQEKAAEADLIKLQAERAHVDESAAEAKRAEDKILRGTDYTWQILSIFFSLRRSEENLKFFANKAKENFTYL